MDVDVSENCVLMLAEICRGPYALPPATYHLRCFSADT